MFALQNFVEFIESFLHSYLCQERVPYKNIFFAYSSRKEYSVCGWQIFFKNIEV